ncbi:MAG: VWA domain-containing protein [Cyclobacteriaceae bacterium]|nr:VWA domain-containing protein [Cyclobacteriaceae bacterium]
MAIQFDQKLKRCDDSRLEAPFAQNNHDKIISVLKNLGPKGNTPIAYSLEQAANDFPMDGKARNIIIIITDGIESCDGDPCAVSLQLQRKGIFLKPFIIGIGMDKKFEEQFGCMGSFYDAANINQFRHALNQALFQSLGKTTVSVELLDVNDQPNETNVNVSFINHFTQTSAFEFVHYRDNKDRPDSVDIDPVLSYDVIVNTIPPVRINDVGILAGKHNVLRIKSPQGVMGIRQAGYTEYKNGVLAIVRKPGSPDILTTLQIPGDLKLLVGIYDIECITLPRRAFRGIRVEQSEISEIILEKPGVVNFLASAPGIGSLYELDENGVQRWFYNLDQSQLRNTLAIQPGRYKVVFRSVNARGSKFTTVRNFEVASGSSLNINL